MPSLLMLSADYTSSSFAAVSQTIPVGIQAAKDHSVAFVWYVICFVCVMLKQRCRICNGIVMFPGNVVFPALHYFLSSIQLIFLQYCTGATEVQCSAYTLQFLCTLYMFCYVCICHSYC